MMLKAGAKLCVGEKKQQLVIRFRGINFRLCIRETSERKPRDLTREEVAKKRLGTLGWIPDPYEFTPTGRIRFEIREEDGYSAECTVTGTATSLRERIGEVLPLLCTRAAMIRVRTQMRDEEHERWQAAWRQRQALAEKRDRELERLKEIEQEATDWRRAARLRQYADALEQGAGSDPTLAKDVSWIRNAADWLDPLTGTHWPAVDIDESSNDSDHD